MARYVDLLSDLFLVQRLPPFHAAIGLTDVLLHAADERSDLSMPPPGPRTP